jgi:NB-ARC domain
LSARRQERQGTILAGENRDKQSIWKKIGKKMELDAITGDAVKIFLDGLHDRKDLSQNPLLALDILLDQWSVSPVEKVLRLEEILRKITLAQLNLWRQVAAASTSKPSGRVSKPTNALKHNIFLEQFKADCDAAHNGKNKELYHWSTLYHYYLFEPNPHKDDLAAVAGTLERNIRYWLKDGVNLLVRELRYLEKQAHEQFQGKHLFRNIPSYSEIDPKNLVGVKPLVDQIVKDLSCDSSVRIISLEGIGGIGKTAAALAIAHEIAKYQHFENIVWVSARQRRMTLQSEIETLSDAAETYEEVIKDLCDKLGVIPPSQEIEDRVNSLMDVLIANPYLVVIDNLETLGDVVKLLPTLEKLSVGASKFLLTTRHSLRAYAYVKQIPLKELSREDSDKLLRRLADGLTSDHSTQIYDLIGGIPLIIHLVAGQIKRKNFATVLEGLQRKASQFARDDETADDKLSLDDEELKRREMFDYVYKTTWLLLSDNAETLMLRLGHHMVATGSSYQRVRFISLMPELEFSQALDELIGYHLVTVMGTVDERVYSIHRFTQMFVQTQFEQPSL